MGTASLVNRLVAASNRGNIMMINDDMFDEVEQNIGRLLLTPIQIVYTQHSYDEDEEDY
jgi:hypothetical protein